MLFLFFSCAELLRFYYWNINNCYKKYFLIFVPFLILSLCQNDVVYVMIEIFQKIQFISLFLLDDWHHLCYVFKNSVPQCTIENFPNIFFKEHLFMSCCIQFLKWNALSLYFYLKNSFSKNIHYIIHLIFKNGINNIFPSQTSFLLLSSNTHASFANKPIKFCCCKPNTQRHIFAIVVYVLPS